MSRARCWCVCRAWKIVGKLGGKVVFGRGGVFVGKVVFVELGKVVFVGGVAFVGKVVFVGWGKLSL